MSKLHIYTVCVFVFNNILMLKAGTIMLPGDGGIESEFRRLNDFYIHPLIKFKGVGLLECDSRLIYSINEPILEMYKEKRSLSTLEFMYLLSEDHWIALNKKEHEYAKKISIRDGRYFMWKIWQL